MTLWTKWVHLHLQKCNDPTTICHQRPCGTKSIQRMFCSETFCLVLNSSRLWRDFSRIVRKIIAIHSVGVTSWRAMRGELRFWLFAMKSRNSNKELHLPVRGLVNGQQSSKSRGRQILVPSTSMDGGLPKVWFFLLTFCIISNCL